jgi:hypothetical protein
MVRDQICLLGERPDPERMNAPRWLWYSGKPGGGLWTSSETERGDSAWARYARQHGPDSSLQPDQPRWRLAVSESVRIYELDSVEAAERLAREYPPADPEGRIDRASAAAGQGLIDWEAVGRDWDGVHFTRFPVPEHCDVVWCWGWDTECTWWSRWSFERVELAAPSLSALDAPARGDVEPGSSELGL